MPPALPEVVDEIRRNDETRMTKTETARLRAIRHSCFGFLLSFGFRISSFGILARRAVHAQLIHQKSPTLRGFFDDLARRLARAVAGPSFDPDEDRRHACLRGLQGGGVLETVRRHHAVVVV